MFAKLSACRSFGSDSSEQIHTNLTALSFHHLVNVVFDLANY